MQFAMRSFNKSQIAGKDDVAFEFKTRTLAYFKKSGKIFNRILC